jgi:hypothetical protein
MLSCRVRWVFGRILPVLVAIACTAGCSQPPRDTSADTTGASAAVSSQALPPMGLAVMTDAGWCAEFPGESAPSSTATAAGLQSLTLLLLDGKDGATRPARLGELRQAPCPTAFPQPRWEGYSAYRVESPSPAVTDARTSTLAIVIANQIAWSTETDGRLRADLDGDGLLEEAHRCAADEGEHFSVWTVRADGSRERRWHEYVDWGAFTDPTCTPGDDGLDPAVVRD